MKNRVFEKYYKNKLPEFLYSLEYHRPTKQCVKKTFQTNATESYIFSAAETVSSIFFVSYSSLHGMTSIVL